MRRFKKTPPRKERPVINENCPLKVMGDEYERHIGEMLEKRGEVVIYNGLIMGINDSGVDLISISSRDKTVNLIQCKNWTSRSFIFSEIKDAYWKLRFYTNPVDQYTKYFSFKPEQINNHARKPHNISVLNGLLEDMRDNPEGYRIIKTLYVSNGESINMDQIRRSALEKNDYSLHNNKKILEQVQPKLYIYSDFTPYKTMKSDQMKIIVTG